MKDIEQERVKKIGHLLKIPLLTNNPKNRFYIKVIEGAKIATMEDMMKLWLMSPRLKKPIKMELVSETRDLFENASSYVVATSPTLSTREIHSLLHSEAAAEELYEMPPGV